MFVARLATWARNEVEPQSATVPPLTVPPSQARAQAVNTPRPDRRGPLLRTLPALPKPPKNLPKIFDFWVKNFDFWPKNAKLRILAS